MFWAKSCSILQHRHLCDMASCSIVAPNNSSNHAPHSSAQKDESPCQNGSVSQIPSLVMMGRQRLALCQTLEFVASRKDWIKNALEADTVWCYNLPVASRAMQGTTPLSSGKWRLNSKRPGNTIPTDLLDFPRPMWCPKGFHKEQRILWFYMSTCHTEATFKERTWWNCEKLQEPVSFGEKRLQWSACNQTLLKGILGPSLGLDPAP